MSYDRNVANLKSSTRQNLAVAMEQNRIAAEREGQAHIDKADQIATALGAFSGSLKAWKEADIKKKTQQGKIAARRHSTADAERMAALAEELSRTKEQDTRYQEIKQEMLRLGGPNAYPDAERIANLSPWQQVGYAKEKIRAFNETFDDKLAHAMQNSEKAITISGVTFTPKELRDNNITGLPFKEAAVKVLSEDIRDAANIDRFSPELQALGGVDDAVIKAQEGQMAKYRERYNIDSSNSTRLKAQKEWASSAKTSEDLHRLFLINSNTVDKNNNLLGNAGGWDSAMGVLTNEGIASGDPFYAEKLGALELPPNLRAQVGAKAGTTFAQQWPGRFAKLKTDIKAGMVSANNAELAYQETAGTELKVQFIEAARKGDLSTAQVNQYKRRFGELGLPIPSSITNYETATMRNEREDKQLIESLMASQNGYISNEQLDSFHPKAALEFRDKATKLEEGAIKKHGAEAKIKAHLNTAFTNMGIKGNEKSPAWVEALENAKVDYANKYNSYVAMGYSSAEASHHALNSPQVINKETGEPIPDSMGVLHEIRTNAENSKYVVTGQSVEKDLKPGHIRVARIHGAKEEILNDPKIVTNGIVGGDYGHRQITSIKNNIEKHGIRGLYMDKGALQYYKGITRGRNAREGGWWALVDAQLKAAGHEGLNNLGRPAIMDYATGKDKDGNVLPDPHGNRRINKQVSTALQFPSNANILYAMNQVNDQERGLTGLRSVWDEENQLLPWVI